MKIKRRTAELFKIKAVLAVFSAMIVCVGCSRQSAQPFSMQDYIMDTVLTQKIYSSDGNAAEIADEVLQLLKTKEKRFSAFDESSEVYKINAANGKAVSVSEETFELIETALGFGKESDWIFDVSVLPLSSLWKTAIKEQKLPDESEISAAKQLVDGSRIALDRESLSVTVPQNMGIDLGAAAKGAALEGVKALYKEHGVSGALCSLGGSAMLLWGDKDGEDFKIGLRAPFKEASQQTFATLSLTNCIISTSGGYERYTQIEDKIYHHIIDTKTGYSAESDIASVTVIGQDGVFCDYMSTRLFLEGFEAACRMVSEKELDAVIVAQDKKVFVSNSLADRLEITAGGFERI